MPLPTLATPTDNASVFEAIKTNLGTAATIEEIFESTDYRTSVLFIVSELPDSVNADNTPNVDHTSREEILLALENLASGYALRTQGEIATKRDSTTTTSSGVVESESESISMDDVTVSTTQRYASGQSAGQGQTSVSENVSVEDRADAFVKRAEDIIARIKGQASAGGPTVLLTRSRLSSYNRGY